MGDRTSARPSSGKRYLFEEERGHLRENAIFSSEDVAVFEQTRPFRRSTQPSWRKRHLLEGGHDNLREDAIFSKKHATILEKTSASRRWTRPPSRKCDLVEEARSHLRENAVYSKKHATYLRENAIFSKEDVTIFEKTSSSRRSTYQRVPVNLLSSYWWGSGRDPKSGGGMRCFVAASYAEARRKSIGSEKGRPKNMIPTGSFAGTGPDRRVPPGAAASRTRSKTWVVKPAGTDRVGMPCCPNSPQTEFVLPFNGGSIGAPKI